MFEHGEDFGRALQQTDAKVHQPGVLSVIALETRTTFANPNVADAARRNLGGVPGCQAYI